MINSHSHFANEMLSAFSSKDKTRNPLIDCINVMIKKMGFDTPLTIIDDLNLVRLDNFDSYSKQLGVLLCKVTASIQGLRSSTFPLLFQEKNTKKLYVILQFKRSQAILYDSSSYKEIKCDLAKIVIENIWQCCPIKYIPQSGTRGLFKYVLKYFKKNILLSIILGGITGLSGLLVSILSGHVFNHLHEAGDPGYLVLFYAFFFLFLGAGILSGISDLFAKIINAKAMYFIMPGVMSRLMSISLKTMNLFTSGEINQRFSDYESAISSIITNCFNVIYSGLTLLILMFYLIYCNAMLAMIYLSICFLFFAIKIILMPKNIAHIAKAIDQQGRVASLLNEIFLQIHKIRSSHSEREVFQRWLKSSILAKSHTEQSTKLEISLLLLESLAPFILLLFFYYKLYFSTEIVVAFFFLQFMVCAGQFLSFFDRFSSNIMVLIHLSPNLKRLEPLFSNVSSEAVSHSTSHDFKGHIQLHNVSLRHDNQNNLILKNISMTIRPGQFIAIIGESGSGKSSLLRLLLGLESATTGAILFDNTNINDLDMYQIRKQFGVVLQTSAIFLGTVFSNIAANTSLTTDQAWELATSVGLDEDLNAMPMKMHTYLSDNAGESISGGQTQKILIARALAAKPKILFLDEATSALDAQSQECIYKNLNKMNMTKIVIAHRLSTIRDADMIYVLKQGELIAQGTFEELQESRKLV